MGMRAALNHVTHYRYDRPIHLGIQTIRLRPAPHTRSHIQSYSLKITPKEHFINWQQDPFGNYLARVIFPEKISEFRVEVDVVTEIRVFNPFDFFLEDYAKTFPFTYEPLLKEELAPYLEVKERGPKLLQSIAEFGDKKSEMVDFLVAINQRLNQSLKYVVRLEPGIQACEDTLRLGSGSCRDMAWLLCQMLRHLGFATRFASGYLIQLKADVKALDGPSGTTEDFTDLHAWTEVYLPGAGWVGLDPTSGLFVEGHIPLCCTPSPSSAAPISGTIEACESTLTHTMCVTRIEEESRITKPYTDAQWTQIDELGSKVDADLQKRDVRLTMGGEPTFVSATDRKSDEWNFTALSPEKKALGNQLLLRLREQFAPGSLLHYTQGKWYPGELLPRWAMNCFWRKDGQAVWENDALLANPEKDHGHTVKTAQKFLSALAETLGIPAAYMLPAREDTPYYLWKEHRLPITGEIFAADMHEQAERARLQTLLDEQLNDPVAYVLPLHFSRTRKGWISNRWKFRGEHMVLLPGDSPVGLRLPLGSLPHVAGAEQELYPERTPDQQTAPLPKRASLLKALATRAEKSLGAPAFANDENGLIKSALCAQVRGGVLHLFLPPVAYIEHFLELVAAIETVAASLNLPLVLEGYGPPADQRLTSFSVTPDPGVIEVNIQPATTWPELKAITSTVYEQAHLNALSAEKFLLDGRCVGTGGGNHLVMGAATTADSPFLRRPDLLQSLISFWQNHPSLSYLFSGMYIGPTSQSPRIDEARHDSLYELEIAFQQITPFGEMEPAAIDRLLRNLLIDLTGNTHRAEFCIDKLYSPEGRKFGLLEMRGFEMTPHPQMNLLQCLLLRAAIAHFWKTPYRAPLIRWGTSLHDRFMLPHYVEQDFIAVLAELKAGGYHFPAEWFAPFFTFRFPEYGKIQLGEMALELRMALEPWPVMGEEISAGGMSRSVDSSVERLQVSIRGLTDARYIVTCNSRRIPLKATADHGTYVAGVRYKAWAPASGLHQNIPVHTPLVFDVIDTQAERSIGGCMYHVAHPGGRNYETIPINSNEAEGRRLSRFEAIGHTPGHVTPPPAEPNAAFPHTLDLRCMPFKQ